MITSVPLTTAASGGLEPVPLDVRLPMGATAADVRPPEPPPPKEVCCFFRVVHHWTQGVVAAADVVVAVPSAYSWIATFAGGTNLLWVAVPGTVAVLGLTVAFVAIGCLTPRKELERQIDFYRDQVVEEKKVNLNLGANITKLEQVRDAMEKEVGEAKVLEADLTRMFQTDMKDFGQTAATMEVFLKQANGLVDLYQKFREMFLETKRANDEYRRLNNLFQTQIQHLGGTVTALDRNEGEFGHRVEQLDSNVKGIEQVNVGLDTRIEELKQFGSAVHGDLTRMTDHVSSLAQHVDGIDVEALRQAVKAVKDLNSVLSKLEKVQDKKDE